MHIELREKSRKIKILAQPRNKYRPRTETESRVSAHYIRCDESSGFSYPTIAVSIRRTISIVSWFTRFSIFQLNPEWEKESSMNIIEVALIDINNEAHPYRLINKQSGPELSENVTVAHCSSPNVLYFQITKNDFVKGNKSYVKWDIVHSYHSSTWAL